MRALLYWFIGNPVAANMLMLVILVAGALSLWNIRIEGFPKIPADSVTVTIIDVELNAVDIDRAITQPVERHLESLHGVRSTSSFSYAGQSIVSLRKTNSADLERLLDDVKTRLDTLTDLPSTAERPVVAKADASFAAMIVQVYGKVGPKELQRTARVIKERLLARPEIAEISQWGERRVEISIDVSKETLRAFDLTLGDIAEVIGRGSTVQRDGELVTTGGSIQIRTDQLSRTVRQFSDLPVTTGDTGATVRLSDIATITESFADEPVYVRFQSEPAIGFEVLIDNNGNLLQIDQAVKAVIESSGDVLSDSIKADVWANQTTFVSERLATLRQSAWQGLSLVFVILACFLSVKLAFWVAVGIPVSLAGTLAVMTSSGFGFSLNDITTFGMIIVLGILVDDAVVVGESVHTAQAEYDDPLEGTGIGVERVATATVFGVLTTMAAFLPMTTFQDPIGKLFGSFAVVIIIALAFSLIESKFILPSHLISRRRSATRQAGERLRWRCSVDVLPNFFGGLLHKFTRRIYRPALAWSLKYRWPTLVLFVAVAYAVYGLVSVGHIRTVFFPAIPGNVVSVMMEFDSRMPRQTTLTSARHVAQIADELNIDLIEQYELQMPPISKLMMAVIGPSNVQIHAELSGTESRPMDALAIADLWRRRAGLPEGAIKMEFLGSEETSDGFELEVYADTQKQLEAAVGTTLHHLQAIEGVSDVRSNSGSGQADLSIALNPTGIALGLEADSLARQISSAYGGVEVQRHQTQNDEVKVFVRYPKQQRDSLGDLLDDPIRLSEGQWVPVSSIARIESQYAASWLWRKDRQLAALVTAHVDKSQISSPEAYAQLLDGGLESHLDELGGARVVPVGEIAQQDEVSHSLWQALILGCVLIYVLLAIPLRSYFQPLIILSVVPFGFVGAALGHYCLGIPFSVLSFFGMLALSGIVVNDSLLLVTTYNYAVRHGADDPIMNSASCRFRAVFLTTVTTVVGLTPILLQSSEQAQYLIPAAVSIVFGELFATSITLILVPVLISIFHRDRTTGHSVPSPLFDWKRSV